MHKQATPRQRIREVTKQVYSLGERFNGLQECPPNMCCYCRNFWFEDHTSYFDSESDWGCNHKPEPEAVGDRLHCRWFAPKRNWREGLQNTLIKALYSSVNKLAPYGQTLQGLENTIASTRLAIIQENHKLSQAREETALEFARRKRVLATLIPAQTLAILLGKGEELLRHYSMFGAEKDLEYPAPKEVKHETSKT
jgi:hypothetical protein